MIRRLAATLLAVLCLAAVDAPASAQRAVGDVAADRARLDALVAQYAAYGEASNAVVVSAAGLLDYVIVALTEAVTLIERDAPRAEREAWALRFNAEADRRTAELERLNRAVPTPTGDMRALLADPMFASQRRGFAAMDQGRIQVVGAANELLVRVRGNIAKFVVGDPDAAIGIAIDVSSGMATSLEAENAMLEASEIAGEAIAHPQSSLARSQRLLNSALAQFFIYRAAQMQGLEPSAAEAERRIRGFTAEARIAARAIEGRSDAMLRRYAQMNDPRITPLLARARTAFSTFGDSATVELRIADMIDGAAPFVGAEGDRFEEAIEALDRLINERVALQERRARILAP